MADAQYMPDNPEKLNENYTVKILPCNKKLKDLENSKRWVEILQARQNNPELDHLCEQVEILYELGKGSK